MNNKAKFCMWILVGSGIGALIQGDSRAALISATGAIIIYALSV